MKGTTTTVNQSPVNWELRYHQLFAATRDGIVILDAATGLVTDVNPSFLQLSGYAREEFVARKLWEVDAFKELVASRESFQELLKNDSLRYENVPLWTKSGQPVQVEFVSNRYPAGGGKVIQCTIRENTDRKAAEEAIRAKDEAHWSLLENLEAHWLLVENLPAGVIVHAPDTRILIANPEAVHLLGMSAEELMGKAADDPVWHFVREDGTRMPPEELPVNRVIATGQVLKNYVVGFARKTGGDYIWTLVNAYPDFDSGGKGLRQVVVTLTDITDIKGAEARIRLHLEHMTALVEIDRAINFSFDLNLSLTTLLTHLIVQLGVDAADVLLFNSGSQTLEYVAGRGFHTKAIEQARQRLGEGYAGRAAQERCIVHIPDLAEDHDGFIRAIPLAGEKFVSYYGVPLLAKGELKGVLEVFHRTRFVRDKGWRDFLTALAAQAAIAIDNATLFDNLQRSNTELTQAYDATIEGWSRALELRDQETEGHSQRVADLTVRLARLFGLGETDLVQVRWGALLHDIGKMGIPDEILLKQEPLTEEEWIVMKKHPVFAYEMLSPIRYLRLALEIPYAHHEKWDGSGYPLGLRGEQIPLLARIFAVVDVWDALISDRRYRASWTVEKVREHLRSLAGTHFDPHVIDVCLDSCVLVEQ